MEKIFNIETCKQTSNELYCRNINEEKDDEYFKKKYKKESFKDFWSKENQDEFSNRIIHTFNPRVLN